MYHANLFVSILFIFSKIPILWSVHHASPFNNSFKTNIVVALNILLSYFSPKKIIYCSEYAFKTHSPKGFNKKIQQVIYNGIDTNLFRCKSNRYKSKKIRIGFVGRWDPIKNHNLFINVVGDLFNNNCRNIEIIMAGQQINDNNTDLVESLNKNAVKDKIKLLDECDKIVSLLCNLDILVSCSFEESFGLVIAEAMACETLCVVTNTGNVFKNHWGYRDSGTFK